MIKNILMFDKNCVNNVLRGEGGHKRHKIMTCERVEVANGRLFSTNAHKSINGATDHNIAFMKI